MTTIDVHNAVFFWIGTVAIGLGFGMALTAIGFALLRTAVVGMLLMFGGILLMLLGA
jgi:hypothetical protein